MGNFAISYFFKLVTCTLLFYIWFNKPHNLVIVKSGFDREHMSETCVSFRNVI